ncbi:MAG: PIN domain-containing protein [Cyanobacteria bacterium J06635_1]
MIIADTGVFVALFNKRDKYHALARQALSNVSEPLITTYPVITETCYLLAQLANQTAERNFLTAITRSAAEVFHLQPIHLKRMIILMQKYEDLPMDLADTSLVVLAEQLGQGRILTVDRKDFSVYRWKDTQTFQNLLLAP